MIWISLVDEHVQFSIVDMKFAHTKNKKMPLGIFQISPNERREEKKFLVQALTARNIPYVIHSTWNWDVLVPIVHFRSVDDIRSLFEFSSKPSTQVYSSDPLVNYQFAQANLSDSKDAEKTSADLIQEKIDARMKRQNPGSTR